MPGFYSTLKCLGTIIPYGDLLYLPMLIDENTAINPMNHKEIPWLQKDANKSAFFVTVLAHYLHKNEENSFIARRRIYIEDIIGNNELIRLFLCGNDVDFQIVGKLQSRDLKAISILRRIYKNENEAMADEATQYLPSDFGSTASSVFDKPIQTAKVFGKKEPLLKKPLKNAQKDIENRLREDLYFLRKQLETLKNENVDLKKSKSHNPRK
eukprot:09104.XXX_136330_137095_1 [CDS] Oithona nana genome sequencing.